MFADVKPIDHQETLKERAQKDSMVEEISFIEKSETWELTKLPKGKNVIAIRWVFKLKVNPKGKFFKHKARLVAKKILQLQGIDYDLFFSQIVRHGTIKLVIDLTCYRGWSLFHLGVKFYFLNGPLEEEMFIFQPPSFVIKAKEGLVWKLHKAFHGLKHAPRAWNRRIGKNFIEARFRKCNF